MVHLHLHIVGKAYKQADYQCDALFNYALKCDAIVSYNIVVTII